jgi:HEAT repeat protein
MAWLRPAAAAALIALGFVAARITVTSPSSEAIATRVRSVEPSAAGAVRVVVEETRQRVVSGRLDEEPIQQLLLAAARDSSDPGLRLESVDLLKNKCDSEEVRHALLYALQNDPNAGVRLKVMEGLKRFAGDAESRKVLAKVLLTDDNPGVRIQAVDLLTQNNETDVVGVLQQLLRKEDNNYVRVRSQNALRAMNASWGTF